MREVETAEAVEADADRVFTALASPVRREVLRILREQGPQPVALMAGRFDMARPSFSEHLRVLREAGLVSERKVGRQRFYRLEAVPLHEVQEWLNPFERFWRERLADLRDVLASLPEDPNAKHLGAEVPSTGGSGAAVPDEDPGAEVPDDEDPDPVSDDKGSR